MPHKKRGGLRELPPIVLEDSATVSAKSLMRGIEHVRSLRRAQHQFEHEASVRARLGSSNVDASRTASSLGDKAIGAIEMLEHIHELPEGAVNWSEVIDRAVLKNAETQD